MSRRLNTESDKQTIYEIFRACRLCGAGGGYKMPIIQNVIDIDDYDVELRKKIRDCIQIEVHQDDKMPPLICELCIDKVNDFYEFLDMCKQVNQRTRQRLGLPLQNRPPDNQEDCILGITEPVYVHDDSSEDEPLSRSETRRPELKSKGSGKGKKSSKTESMTSKQKSTPPASKQKQSPPSPLKPSKSTPSSSKSKPGPASSKSKAARRREVSPIEDVSSKNAKSLRNREVSPMEEIPPPKRVTRNAAVDDEVRVEKEKTSPATPDNKPLKSSSKKDVSIKVEEKKLNKKRPPERTESPPAKVSVPSKKFKLSPKGLSKPSKPQPRAPSPPKDSSFSCNICLSQAKTYQGLHAHLKSHTVTFTQIRLSCNACEEWFTSYDEAKTHHAWHRMKNKPYRCRYCSYTFDTLLNYQQHFTKYSCAPFTEVPDVQCAACWDTYPTHNLLNKHRCRGEKGRPANCGKCGKYFTRYSNMKKHEKNCSKIKYNVDPEVLSELKNLQIRTAKCDPLLALKKGEHYDITYVMRHYGLDNSCVYPYLFNRSLRVKTEANFDGMVKINEDVKREFENFIHWDSDYSDDSDTELIEVIDDTGNKCRRRKLDDLSTLCLKIIFSSKFLGKIPRKIRKDKVKKEELFDATANVNENDFSNKINNLIDSLGDRDDVSIKVDNIIDRLGIDDDKGNDTEGSDHVVSLKEVSEDTASMKSESILEEDEKEPETNEVEKRQDKDLYSTVNSNLNESNNEQRDCLSSKDTTETCIVKYSKTNEENSTEIKENSEDVAKDSSPSKDVNKEVEDVKSSVREGNENEKLDETSQCDVNKENAEAEKAVDAVETTTNEFSKENTSVADVENGTNVEKEQDSKEGAVKTNENQEITINDQNDTQISINIDEKAKENGEIDTKNEYSQTFTQDVEENSDVKQNGDNHINGSTKFELFNKQDDIDDRKQDENDVKTDVKVTSEVKRTSEVKKSPKKVDLNKTSDSISLDNISDGEIDFGD